MVGIIWYSGKASRHSPSPWELGSCAFGKHLFHYLIAHKTRSVFIFHIYFSCSLSISLLLLIMDVTSMDSTTAQVAVELQLADVDDLLDGPYDEDDIPEGDRRISFQFLRRDLQRQLHILDGQAFALRILKEEHDAHVAFTRLLDEERRAATDH
jgi:hypothetical protein